MSAKASLPLVTLDTSAVEPHVFDHAGFLGYEVQVVTVTAREVEGTSFEVPLEHTRRVLELGHFGESRFGQAVFAGPSTKETVEAALDIISGGSFPANRAVLTVGQKHQLRDAMILEAHVRSGADLFVTDDARAYVKHGRREALKERLGVRILLVAAFLALTSRRT